MVLFLVVCSDSAVFEVAEVFSFRFASGGEVGVAPALVLGFPSVCLVLFVRRLRCLGVDKHQGRAAEDLGGLPGTDFLSSFGHLVCRR